MEEVFMASRGKQVIFQDNKKCHQFTISKILCNDYLSYSLRMTAFKWVKVFKNGPSKLF